MLFYSDSAPYKAEFQLGQMSGKRLVAIRLFPMTFFKRKPSSKEVLKIIKGNENKNPGTGTRTATATKVIFSIYLVCLHYLT